MKHFVEIVKYEGGEVVKKLGPFSSERVAIRADSGANYNLNHEEYYTKIVQTKRRNAYGTPLTET